ncbi:endoglucanase [Exophiala viscosa]|uniref:endoglucanase n=1 Tax=Exophiala viscosa TaxID=2486360 RepID=UPI0021952A56|nr:endoglucanase [Exophiala viscosa]
MTKPVLLANAFAATCLFASYGATAGCSALYGQCGGIGWTGATCCATGSSCQYVNGNYYQCLTSTTPTTSKVSTSSTTSTLKSSSSSSTTTASASASSTGDRLQYGGVNIAGFEFGSYDTCGIHTAQPDADPTDFVAQIKHFVDDDKLNAFRLPVSWQYLINQFDGSSLGTNKLDSNNFATYDDLVQGCLDAGASLCIIDIHNYARFNGYIIGQDGPTAAQFASLWSQIATNYASESRVAFGLMNEPHDESCNSANGGVMDIDTWAATLQTVVNAIRSAGATSQLIIMPGKGWTHSITYLDASGDGSGPALMGITDPAGGTSKLVFEVHEYLDSNNAGSSSDCVTSSIDSSYGRGGLQNLANYLRSNGRFAMITESGGLNNANCATYLCKELNFLANNTDVFLGYTTWAAGGFDSSYELTETPTLSGSTWTDTSLVQACVAKCFTGTC